MSIGDRVRFVLSEDIEAMIIGISTRQSGREYLAVWIDHGDRKEAWVQECEIKEIEQ